MSLRFAARLLAVVLGVYLGLEAWRALNGQTPEGAMGSLPIPSVVRMSGECAPPGFVVAVGEVNASQHEADEGYFAFGEAKGLSVFVVPETPAWHRFVQARGKEWELVLRPYTRER